ncbi:MAG: hypothetical protein ABSG80_00495 [Verrucomicrobiota bacterium]|jgi:hypothetical protein
MTDKIHNVRKIIFVSRNGIKHNRMHLGGSKQPVINLPLVAADVSRRKFSTKIEGRSAPTHVGGYFFNGLLGAAPGQDPV